MPQPRLSKVEVAALAYRFAYESFWSLSREQRDQQRVTEQGDLFVQLQSASDALLNAALEFYPEDSYDGNPAC